MSSKHTPAQTPIRLARTACEAVAEGPFTPIAFEPYEFFRGDRGWTLGRPGETADGRSYIVWSNPYVRSYDFRGEAVAAAGAQQ